MKRRYIPPGVKMDPLLVQFTRQERNLLKQLSENASKSEGGFIRDRIFPRGGFDLFSAKHPLGQPKARGMR